MWIKVLLKHSCTLVVQRPNISNPNLNISYGLHNALWQSAYIDSGIKVTKAASRYIGRKKPTLFCTPEISLVLTTCIMSPVGTEENNASSGLLSTLITDLCWNIRTGLMSQVDS